MEKVVFYKAYFFEDLKTGEKYYYEDKPSCEIARFCVYKRYDKERLSINGFVVPVSQVQEILIPEKEIENIEFQESLANQMS